MAHRNTTSLLAGAALALCLAAGPFQATRAAAQEAITLESIGAVRMATPDEVRRNNAAPSRPTAQRRPQAAPQQHAAIAE